MILKKMNSIITSVSQSEIDGTVSLSMKYGEGGKLVVIPAENHYLVPSSLEVQ